MKFLVQPINKSVETLYKNLSTFNEGDSGFDLFTIEDVVINPGETKIVGMGVKCQLQSPKWYCKWAKQYHSYNLYARSSISKTPLLLANGIGLIDAGYTGEIKAPFHNTGLNPFTLQKGVRYVQLARADLGKINVEFKPVSGNLRDTERGSNGFGST